MKRVSRFAAGFVHLIRVNPRPSVFGSDVVPNEHNAFLRPAITRENPARAFARRIDNGTMGQEEALDILRTWFFENPVRFYRLSIPAD